MYSSVENNEGITEFFRVHLDGYSVRISIPLTLHGQSTRISYVGRDLDHLHPNRSGLMYLTLIPPYQTFPFGLTETVSFFFFRTGYHTIFGGFR